VLCEYKKPFVLLEIVRVSFARDIVNFLLVQLAMWVAFSIASSALYLRTAEATHDENADAAAFFKQFLYLSVGVDPSFELADAGARPFAGSYLILIFGLLEVIVMLNLLIAMLASTFEAVTERAGGDFEMYRAQRIIDNKCKPASAAPVYLAELAPRLVGAAVRACTRRTWSTPSPLGWRRRPCFHWERADWVPDPDDASAASDAIDEMRKTLHGGWRTSVKAAKAAVEHAGRSHDNAVATRDGVQKIVRAEVGDVRAEVGDVRAEVGEMRGKLEGIESKLDALLARA